MKLNGKWSVVLFLFVLGGSIFFTFQHRLEYTTYKLDETWNLDPSLTIMLKEITVKKFMDNPIYFDRRPWYRSLLPYSPEWLRSPAEYGFDPSKAASTFIFDVLKEGKNDSVEKQLYPKVTETFPWSYLPQELEKREFALHNLFPTYEGEFKGFQEVYSINLEYSSVDDIDNITGKQKIYLIQDDEDLWKILDLTPYQPVNARIGE